MPNYSRAILFDVRDHVAHLTIKGPEAANSLNNQVSAELMDAIAPQDRSAWSHDVDVRPFKEKC